ncbi:MAG: glycosyltransferase [Flavobacteriaceae bacterium]|nr:glycosyltransferase [Flavobacteriaceae bacterium]
MRILLNASTIVHGGGIQVAINIIETFVEESNLELCIISSLNLYEALEPKTKKHVKVIESSPAKLLSFRSRNKILSIADNFNPDIIYSVGAPSYINFKQKEVLRLTNPYIIGIRDSYLINSSFYKKYFIWLKTYVQRLFISKNHFIITQTDLAKEMIQENLKVPPNKIKVISNSLTKYAVKTQKNILEKNVILTLGYPYPHKNVRIIPDVAYHLKKLGAKDFKFIITLGEKNSERKLFEKKMIQQNVVDMIEIIDSIPHTKINEFYSRGNIVFLPSICEIFSATIIEAMFHEKSILAADEDFNKSLFKNDIHYFESTNPRDAAEKLIKLFEREKETPNYTSYYNFFNQKGNYREHLNALIDFYNSN